MIWRRPRLSRVCRFLTWWLIAIIGIFGAMMAAIVLGELFTLGQ